MRTRGFAKSRNLKEDAAGIVFVMKSASISSRLSNFPLRPVNARDMECGGT